MQCMNANAPVALETLLQHALSARAGGNPDAALAAAERVLGVDGRNVLGNILKGDAFAARGDARSASSFYGAALASAQQRGADPELKGELRRVQQALADMKRRFEEELLAGIKARGFDEARSSERFALSLDLLTGRKPLYHQQPKSYLFPGLPQVQFQPRADTLWLAEIEAATPAIRAELEAVLVEPALFAPYVEDRSNRPRSGQAGMLENPSWSAVFLWKDGAVVPEVAARCPQTLKALEAAPLSIIPGRSPSILFSKLAAGARIPPHHGLINTRLICHLPLVAPPGSWFRVGSDLRQWEEGKAWAFDDTIEHEAWNDSDQDRTILIFDVWKPEITEEERGLICALFDAIDAGGGATPKLGT
ncbi:aspartyl/asparaginyl beta-hydroxylase domain-containing protein [Brevundimonas sp. TSRC1-1]|uniref:aspartyl/asparaginyl beta-hydroxylase domain-containing protein n=1 Tax=Brevundimonas sp. TSRC1-1 TaxID=2804562 RepID=UPI003CEC138E